MEYLFTSALALGTWHAEGTGGNHAYFFENGEYKYRSD